MHLPPKSEMYYPKVWWSIKDFALWAIFLDLPPQKQKSSGAYTLASYKKKSTLGATSIKDFAPMEQYTCTRRHRNKKVVELILLRATPLLGDATHFASFHEALAEQSASFVLANKLADTN